MALEDGKRFLIGKLVGVLCIILGFLVAASGYRSDAMLYMIAGVVILAIGIGILMSKVARRNAGA
ncbi:hypothetical protein ABMA32_16750 [Mesorhizobium sp. VNQ89]|uniref:hypothetical protein n=1 Tax=Mesorhizobium quangtriensis TaxID=3157709 RepID=UPI0025F48C52|nr:hypothetical protein [Mesorhizobium sp.]